MNFKKKSFEAPYIGTETIDEDTAVLYNRKGDFSVIIKCNNPVFQYSANEELYYDFHTLYVNVIKILGKGYSVQKQDIFTNHEYTPSHTSEDYLMQKYFAHFEGRSYTSINTYIIITREVEKSKFFTYDKRLFSEFLRNTRKILDVFKNKGMKAKLLSEKEIEIYLKRFISNNFNQRNVALENIKINNENISIGNKIVQSISLVDIDEIDFPNTIRPYREINLGTKLPVDLFSFLHSIPEVDMVIYNQIISIPDQRNELVKLEAKRRKHIGVPDPANELCVVDIGDLQNDIARNNQLLVYAHFNIIVSGYGDVSRGCDYIESSLFDNNIVVSKQSYNQFELFEYALPGNASYLQKYDKFLTTSDAAMCLLFKEQLHRTEKSPFLTYFCDRAGVPIGIDLSGKEGSVRYTNNSNFFVLGPSGSGKSFFVNSIVYQWLNENTDIVIVDTGHSYSGICEYKKGKYITYTEEKPITMNPFRISKREYNREKLEFLKNLIFLIWKGNSGSIIRTEERVVQLLLKEYYANYFSDQDVLFSTKEKNDLIRDAVNEWNEELEEERTEDEIISKTKTFIREQEDEFKKEKLKGRIVDELSFNSFFDFSMIRIKTISEEKNIQLDISSFRFILEAFYVGGEFDKILNNDMDSSLLDEPFIVFEIDAIKDDTVLFPIVTLIIMDVFIQKMRLKKNRKALIIEEAWKAIASPMMSSYILYLYKTVRKFWGMAMVVTQELDDIISNPVVKNSIINNSDIICLLDQAKFKDNYSEIASLLTLSEVEQRKIFTINNLNNKDNRNRFNEIYIKRGEMGGVYGVEVSLQEYFAFTTERSEKDAIAYYKEMYGNLAIAIDHFVTDFQSSKLEKFEWIVRVNKVLSTYSQENSLDSLNGTDIKNFIIDNYKY